MCITQGWESCPGEITAMQQLLTCIPVTGSDLAFAGKACFMYGHLQHPVFTI